MNDADPIPRETGNPDRDRTEDPVLVDAGLVGDYHPHMVPYENEACLGSAELVAPSKVTARSHATFRIVYTMGKLGLDDTGAIRIGFRFITDLHFQTEDPTADNFISATSDGEGELEVTTGLQGQRPWTRTITVQQRGGYLRPGQKITVVIGDRSAGSRGVAVQSFAEAAAEFNVMADVQATGIYVPLESRLHVPIVAGEASRWTAVLPTLRRPGEPFSFGLRTEDKWGNPTALRPSGSVRLAMSRPVSGLPEKLELDEQQDSIVFDGLAAEAGDPVTIEVFVDEKLVAEAGPLTVRDGRYSAYWGDLHGQSAETVGINTVESYFDYARDKAFLDVTSHQGNDFQINRAFWDHLNSVTGAFYEPGRFVTFPGYEWSGNTAVGGDHNVFFMNEGEQIHRCSHALLGDRSDSDTNAPDLTALYKALRGSDCVMYAHVGGRYANLAFDHDPLLETSVEIHSDWGTFEWMLTDSFELKRRVGVVGNSDCHESRPGASYPGTGGFGAYGGLTCFLSERLDRKGVFESMRRRHHYATSGCRLHVDLSVAVDGPAKLYERDPRVVPDTPEIETSCAMMGDLMEVSASSVRLDFEVSAVSGIERIEIRNGAETLKTLHGWDRDSIGRRMRIRWAGAEYRGRGRTTTWNGNVSFSDMMIERFERVAIWNHERKFEVEGGNRLRFDGPVAGNIGGFDIWLNDSPSGTMTIDTNHGKLEAELDLMGTDELVLEAGALGRRLSAFRLPDAPLARSIQHSCEIPIVPGKDNPIWICVTMENGHQAWSSPVYVFNG